MRYETSTEKEMQICIKKLNARLQGVDTLNLFSLYKKAIKDLERRINELKKTKTA